MIQRKQTLWLILASITAFATLKFPFFSGNTIKNNAIEYIHYTAVNSTFLMILTIMVATGCIITIFLYKNRSTQIKISVALLLLSIVNVSLYFSATKNFVPNEYTYELTSVFSILPIVFIFLAIRGMMQDNKIVKEANKLS